jgi:hypothetical protein
VTGFGESLRTQEFLELAESLAIAGALHYFLIHDACEEKAATLRQPGPEPLCLGARPSRRE